MNHIEASLQIFFTTDYARFKMIEGNRQLNEAKIKKIINAIEDGNDMLRYYPIQVIEKKNRLEILDGQHRFYICRKLQVPVFYIMVKEDKKMTEIARVNSAVEKWKNSDFINCYVQQGNKQYETLQNFMDTYGFNVGVSVKLLSKAAPDSSGESGKESFEHGLFEVKHLEAAEELAKLCHSFTGFQFIKDRGFIAAIHRVKAAKLVSIDELIAAHKKYPELLMKHSTAKEYIYNLEQLYNHRKQKRTVIA